MVDGRGCHGGQAEARPAEDAAEVVRLLVTRAVTSVVRLHGNPWGNSKHRSRIQIEKVSILASQKWTVCMCAHEVLMASGLQLCPFGGRVAAHLDDLRGRGRLGGIRLELCAIHVQSGGSALSHLFACAPLCTAAIRQYTPYAAHGNMAIQSSQ